MKQKFVEVIDYLKKKNVDYADIRFVSTTHQSLTAKNGRVEGVSNDESSGFGIRVISKGAWGFASSSIISSAEMQRIADLAVEIANASATTIKEPVRMAESDAYIDSYKTPFKEDPFDVPIDEKLDLLIRTTDALKTHKSIKAAEASCNFWNEKKIFASSEGALIEQDIMQSGGGYSATAVSGMDAQRRSYPNSHRGDFITGGYEFIRQLDFLSHTERVRDEAVALLKASPCPSLDATVIIGGSQMALQVHESCGHPAELDRVLGTEISLAGGSFMTLDKRGGFRYGSPIVNIVQDGTTERGLGTFGYDDEGVKAQNTDVVRDGKFVGYLTSRETAPIINDRSNGCMRADGYNRIPLVRMTNINLEPGGGTLKELIADTKDGYYFDMNKSWSIDDKRLNFQFGVEAAWEITNGKLGRLLKNPVYTGITPEFWGKCDAICGKSDWRVWGVPNCGKGEPMQTARVAHGTSPARFHDIKIGVSK
ncbi:MAG: TldD/PmbA family protein [candidate division Zixibacteria bacterium]|nr:TldD/PmbA family protein [candidate division Zixibacteria bacterium]